MDNIFRPSRAFPAVYVIPGRVKNTGICDGRQVHNEQDC